ncbi:MAG: hercynine metabolism protein [Cyanobacteriota bacterium]|nr:hercynine metabolism protein [Cyanobacteriota bacterium]
MGGSGTWLDHLEARLEQTLEGFLRANPEQEALLAEQGARERQQRLRRDRLTLTTEAELQRQGLLRLAEDIRSWQRRVERAKAAGALDLAGRAEAHIATLMEQGRARWQTLAELGERFAAVEVELQGLATGVAAKASGSQAQGAQPGGRGLEADWAAFETQQELEALRRKLQR